MRTTILGRSYNITKADIEQNLRDIEPEEGKAKYFVEIGGKKYPIKQALSQTLNLAKVAFTSQQAFGILHKLGFKIAERS